MRTLCQLLSLYSSERLVYTAQIKFSVYMIEVTGATNSGKPYNIIQNNMKSWKWNNTYIIILVNILGCEPYESLTSVAVWPPLVYTVLIITIGTKGTYYYIYFLFYYYFRTFRYSYYSSTITIVYNKIMINLTW